MNLHEYQAKQLYADYGIAAPRGEVANTPKAAQAAAGRIPGTRWVVKAQVHAGGRGKAGGVKLVDSPEAVAQAAEGMLGKNLVTYQTTAEGQPVHSVLVEEVSQIARELYLGAVIDRASQRVVFMASTEGGVEIEKVAAETPEKILTTAIDPTVGVQPYQCREFAFGLGLTGDQIKQFTTLMTGMARMFVECDLSLLEVNPLVVTGDGRLVCLDGKINIDDNALYRQPRLAAMRDPSQEDAKENRAREHDISYVALDGNIGCMVNGAGLAMATMDIIKLHGGEPANFLDVGGGASASQVAKAFTLVTADPAVRAIFINIFGGITRGDVVAQGITEAMKEVGVSVPIVVRLAGTNSEEGRAILSAAGMTAVDTMDDAAAAVVRAAV